MYNTKPVRKVYRITQRSRGYNQHQDFPVTPEGLDKALRAWRKGRNRGSGKTHGAIRQVDADTGKEITG